jgi:hypothetical protein
VLSTVPTNAYSLSSGTSMAAPAVTGVAALLTEQWRRTNSGANPRPAQLKALMIAGAGDIGNPGPDYTFGFGLVNARASVDLIRADEGKGNRIRSFTFSQGANDVDGVTVVNEQTQTLRAVLVWSDPAIPYLGGDDIAAKSLVNDIDLYVVDPNGITWHPWTLDRATVDALATRAPNKVDNVEMVEIPNAAPGAYRIFAAGRTITQGPQQAALVTNARPARPCTDVQEASGAGNDTADRATAIASSAIVYAGLCAITDVDFYSFAATKLGPLTVTVRAGDTPLKVTMTGIGVDRVQEVPPNSTAVLSAPVNVAPIQITVKVEAAGAFGPEPQYTLEADFPETRKPKRRTARR